MSRDPLTQEENKTGNKERFGGLKLGVHEGCIIPVIVQRVQNSHCKEWCNVHNFAFKKEGRTKNFGTAVNGSNWEMVSNSCSVKSIIAGVAGYYDEVGSLTHMQRL